jgi:hypothetical protein
MAKDNPALWRRRGDTIIAANDVAREHVRALVEGVDYLATWPFRTKRSLQQLRLWFSLMNLMVEHDLFPTVSAAHIATKIATGHFDIVVAPDTKKQVLAARSIAFDNLPQEEFNSFFNAALKVITERWLRGVDMEELRDLAFSYIDGPDKSFLGRRVK